VRAGYWCGDTYNLDGAYEKNVKVLTNFTFKFFLDTPTANRDTLLAALESLPERLGEVRHHAIFLNILMLFLAVGGDSTKSQWQGMNGVRRER
jgi:hypothetical protein